MSIHDPETLPGEPGIDDPRPGGPGPDGADDEGVATDRDRVDLAPDAVGQDADPAGTLPAGQTPLPPWIDALARRIMTIRPESAITFAIVAASAFFVFQVLYAGGALFDDTIVTGGDMGAHFWGPAFIRDTLLPSGRLSGWSPDWFGGFPAFHFYMIVPALAITLLNIGAFEGVAAVGLLVFLGMAIRLSRRDERLRRWRTHILAGSAVLLVLGIGLPYGVAFKLIVISGLVSMPVSAWAMGKWSGMAFPGPPLLAAASLFFIFDHSFHILGGNGLSTMAGEFAFSIGLSLALLAIGLFMRGLDTGKGSGPAAIALAFTALCHIIPALFAAGAIIIVAVTRVGRRRQQVLGVTAVVLAGVVGLLHVADVEVPPMYLAAALVVAALALLGRDQQLWLVVAGGTAGMLTAFWSLPFVWRRTFMNDMGWEQTYDWQSSLVNRDRHIVDFLRDQPPLEVVLPLAALGFGLSLARRNRLGTVFGLVAPAIAVVFVWLGDEGTRLWNARITPFYYLVLYLLVAIALAESVRLFQRSADEAAEPRSWPNNRFWALFALTNVAVGLGAVPHLGFDSLFDGSNDGWLKAIYLGSWFAAAFAVSGWAQLVRLLVVRRHDASPLRAHGMGADRVARLVLPVVGFVFTWFIVGLPLGSVPLSERVGVNNEFLGMSAPQSYVPGWANYNFKGANDAERLSYPEYRDVLETMNEVGAEHGCGRALWEYSNGQGDYGTPMAMMLLPHFSDGCIGSMEGLYFESSASTPHHFQMQSALSKEPSRPQRDLHYPEPLSIDLGVDMMQLYGVRYYLTYTPDTYALARAQPDLTELAQSGPWVVFEVADANLVEPLVNEPVVVQDLGDAQHEWLGQIGDTYEGSASEFFLDPSLWSVFRSADGPSTWARVERGATPEAVPLPEVVVSDIDFEGDELSFHVDRVGVPVLVKVSYFPNWKVSGADGPYRVQPNLMVVVPTDNDVTLSYGRTPVDVAGIALSALGIGLVLALLSAGRAGRDRVWADPLADRPSWWAPARLAEGGGAESTDMDHPRSDGDDGVDGADDP